ncbi:hypothetical protein CEXT_102081 [Caerostris extrusa]|uniref:Uncharacterized protein n=1 Tax=Caerostris extrusa TaxID=172846 RepID=A0AAV4V235_CAEEX|nr:hypothetical protein CEXT_102081 [Caerostris extrusa]
MGGDIRRLNLSFAPGENESTLSHGQAFIVQAVDYAFTKLFKTESHFHPEFDNENISSVDRACLPDPALSAHRPKWVTTHGKLSLLDTLDSNHRSHSMKRLSTLVQTRQRLAQ